MRSWLSGMATPLSQLVGIQAVLNIVTGRQHRPGRGHPVRRRILRRTVLRSTLMSAI